MFESARLMNSRHVCVFFRIALDVLMYMYINAKSSLVLLLGIALLLPQTSGQGTIDLT